MNDSILKRLSGCWTSDEFPTELCTIPGVREPEVLGPPPDAGWFLCLLDDRRFRFAAELRVLQPYTCPDIDEPFETLYGWTDRDMNIYDHVTKSVHGDPQRVIAWMPWTGTQPLTGIRPGPPDSCLPKVKGA